MMPISDAELRELMQVAAMAPFDLREIFLTRVAAELRGEDLGDGLVHRVAYGVAREFACDADATTDQPPGSLGEGCEWLSLSARIGEGCVFYSR